MNEQFSARRAKQFLAEKLNQTKTQKVFKGSSDQCMLKLASLFGNLDEGTSKLEKGKILNVEDCGFSQYKITYVPT